MGKHNKHKEMRVIIATLLVEVFCINGIGLMCVPWSFPMIYKGRTNSAIGNNKLQYINIEMGIGHASHISICDT